MFFYLLHSNISARGKISMKFKPTHFSAFLVDVRYNKKREFSKLFLVIFFILCHYHLIFLGKVSFHWTKNLQRSWKFVLAKAFFLAFFLDDMRFNLCRGYVSRDTNIADSVIEKCLKFMWLTLELKAWFIIDWHNTKFLFYFFILLMI